MMANQSDAQYDLFISYAEADRAWVQGMLLPTLGLPAEHTITPQDFRLGAARVDEFERAVTTSRYTVLVLSPAYLADEWSMFGEQLVSYAGIAEQRDRLIPLLLNACTLPLRIDFRVRLDCTDESHWEPEAARLRVLLDQPEPTRERIPCPYPGMRPFTEEESTVFFGRRREVDDLLQRLRLHRFLTVIGRSGTGKSSLVFAGLVPALRKRTLFGAGDWLVRSMRPGDTPLDAFQALTQSDGADPSTAVANLLADAHATHLLLVIDQFEEVFTLATGSGQARAFQESLLRWINLPECLIVLTVRAWFYEDLMSCPLWPQIQADRYEVPRLGRDQLREAIVGPAERANVYVEQSLVERLLNDAADEPGILPLVQETMVLLWEKLQRRFLPVHAYEDIGRGDRTGLQVAMATRADAAMRDLPTDADRAVARRIFLRLIQFGESRPDTRRQQSRSQLRSQSDDPGVFDQTLDRLINARLLVAGEPEHKDPPVDIAHERLITGWPTLQQWLVERREAEQSRRRLETKADEWVRLGQGPGGLLDEAELLEAERWLSSPDAADLGHGADLTALVQASRVAIKEAERERKAARQRELAQAQALAQAERQRAEEQARAVKRLRTLFSMATIFAGVAILAAIGAIYGFGEARRQARIATSRQLAAQAELVRSQRADLLPRSLLLAAESMKRYPSLEGDQVLRPWLALLPRPRVHLAHEARAGTITFSPDGKWLAAGSGDQTQTAWVWEVATGQEVARLVHEHAVHVLAFSPDGTWLATGSGDWTRVWEVTTGREVARMVHEGPVHALAFSADGQWLMTASIQRRGWVGKAAPGTKAAQRSPPLSLSALVFSPDDRWLAMRRHDPTAHVWEPLTGRELLSIPLDDYISNVAFSPNGQYFMMAPTSHYGTRMWEVMSGKQLTPLYEGIGAFAFSPEGERLAMWTSDRTVRVWAAATNSEVAVLPCEACEGVVASLAFSHDSRWLATATGGDAFVQVWDVTTRKAKEVARVVPGQGPVAFSPNDRLLATWTGNNTITIWEITPEPEMAQLGWEVNSEPEMAERIGVSAVAFTPDGTWLASGWREHTVQVWEATTGQNLAQVNRPGGMELRVSLSSHGRWLATRDDDGMVQVWEVATAQRVPSLVRERPVQAISFSLDNTRLAMASGDRVWVQEVATGKLVAEVPHKGRVWAIAFSPDGRRLATGGEERTVQVWEFSTKKAIAHMEHERVMAVAFTPDGQWLATGSTDHTVRVWEVATRRVVASMAHEDAGTVRAIDFSPDGKWLATGSNDKTARLWEAGTGRALARMQHESEVEAVAVSPDGTRLVTVSQSQARGWLLRPQDLIAEACARLTLNLTLQEWQQYLREEPYRKTCPALP